MTLGAELEELVSSYVEGRASLDDLHQWLSDHVQAMADSEDAGARELSDRAWMLVSEVDYGHRDEPTARSELADMLAGLTTRHGVLGRSAATVGLAASSAKAVPSTLLVIDLTESRPGAQVLSARISPAGAPG